MPVSKLIAVVLLAFSASAFAEPSMDEVYKAASGGQMQQAQAMMLEVLKAHPDSAKAHFVEAQLLARMGDIAAARPELERAQALNPSLSFAKPQAVQSLKRALGLRAERASSNSNSSSSANTSALPPWVWPVGIGLLMGLIFWMLRNKTASTNNNNYPAGMGQPSQQQQPQQPYGPAGYPQQSSGPSLLGSLVTGAAIGGGIVAGEALAHRLLGSDEPRQGYQPQSVDNAMGGNDFGVNDSSSWDDNSGGGDSGGSDW